MHLLCIISYGKYGALYCIASSTTDSRPPRKLSADPMIGRLMMWSNTSLKLIPVLPRIQRHLGNM